MLRFTATVARLWALLLLAAIWVRGDQPRDDRGSDSSEKSMMIILGITIGGLVTAGAVAWIAKQVGLFQ